MRKKIRYVLGLDIGIASVGWAVLLLDGEDNVCGIVRAGVHTFDEVTVGKEKITATANRRGYRSGRRLVRRKAHRIQRVKSLLQEMNIVSKRIWMSITQEQLRMCISSGGLQFRMNQYIY